MNRGMRGKDVRGGVSSVNCLYLVKFFLASVLSVSIFVNSCAPSLHEVAKRSGCKQAERKISYYAERRIRWLKFREDFKRRAMLAPVSLTLGLLANYLLRVTYVLPAIAPEGFQLDKKNINAIGLNRALHYSNVKGTWMEKLEDKTIARTIFDVGMCYFRNGDWSRAAHHFEKLRGAVYKIYVNECDLLFSLGNCYYMLERYGEALNCYREFIRITPGHDPRKNKARCRIDKMSPLQN